MSNTHQPCGTLTSGGGVSKEADGRVNSVSFTLPSLPGSVNIIYEPRRSIYTNKPDWGLKAEWAIWATRMSPYVSRFSRVSESSVIRVDRCYYYPWFCKNGSWRRADTSNMDKLLFDTVSRKIGVDDLFFKCGWMDSRDSSNARVDVTLTEVMQVEWEQRRERLA